MDLTRIESLFLKCNDKKHDECPANLDSGIGTMQMKFFCICDCHKVVEDINW